MNLSLSRKIVYTLLRLRKATAMFFRPQTTPRSTRNRWHAAFALLLALSMVSFNGGAVFAASNSPDPMPQRKPSAAVQLLSAGVQMAPLLPDLLGFTGPKTYLLLVQNNQELRATGGFITAAGRITIEGGRITDMVIEDSYAIARHDVDHPLAPAAVKRFMNIEILFLRDVNWSPDFPTTARLATSLYAQDTGVQVDGVVTVDLRAVELLVGALAPLQIPDSDVALTGENVLQEIMHFWDRPPTSEVADDVETDSLLQRKDWLYQRKDFIPLIAESAIARLQSGNFNLLRLINGITSALNERAVQIWLDDPTAADLLAQLGWDGGLHPTTNADYVALIDTNMGYNKADAALKRELAHTVTWPNGPTAPAQATVAVTYRHTLNVVDESCSPWTDYGTLDSYTGMIGRCYFGYVRLYVPGGSKLIALDGVQAGSVETQPGEHGTQVFAGYFSVKPGEEHTIIFTYTLPPTITPPNYQLVVQRQSGSGPLPVQVTVNGPALDASVETILSGGSFVWSANTPAVTPTITPAP
jgi:hypothetical protein